ncbi:hypothetical protein ACE193_21255 [Bernardetia sp. OM2101]|uniref:hypothetical protein n=1 Tax=Bernardetia sp. OM2101 TaxID=3344876 RepID=UPI0035CFAF11
MQQPKKRLPQIPITLHEDFEERVRIIAFLLGFNNATDFLIFLIETADQQMIAKAEKKSTHSNRKVFFPQEKGLVEKDSPTILLRFHATPECHKQLLRLTKIYGFKYYSDFIIAMLVEIVARHQDEIQSYLQQLAMYSNIVQKNEKKMNATPILPSKPKTHDTHRIQIS